MYKQKFIPIARLGIYKTALLTPTRCWLIWTHWINPHAVTNYKSQSKWTSEGCMSLKCRWGHLINVNWSFWRMMSSWACQHPASQTKFEQSIKAQSKKTSLFYVSASLFHRGSPGGALPHCKQLRFVSPTYLKFSSQIVVYLHMDTNMINVLLKLVELSACLPSNFWRVTLSLCFLIVLQQSSKILLKPIPESQCQISAQTLLGFRKP